MARANQGDGRRAAQRHPEQDDADARGGRRRLAAAPRHLEHEGADGAERGGAARRDALAVEAVLEDDDERRHGELGDLVEAERVELEAHVVQRRHGAEQDGHGDEVRVAPRRGFRRFQRRDPRGVDGAQRREHPVIDDVVNVRERRRVAEVHAREDPLVQVDQDDRREEIEAEDQRR